MFLIFTKKYGHKNVFENLNAKNFGSEGNDVLIIKNNLQSISFNSYSKSLINEVIDNVDVIFINDIKLSSKTVVKRLLKKIKGCYGELFVLYHQNGFYYDQQEVINEIFEEKLILEAFESHLNASLYYEEIPLITEAFSKQDISLYQNVLSLVHKKYVDMEKEKFRKLLLHKDFKERLNSEDVSSIVKHFLGQDYSCLEKDLFMLPNEAKGEEIRQVLNKYL